MSVTVTVPGNIKIGINVGTYAGWRQRIVVSGPNFNQSWEGRGEGTTLGNKTNENIVMLGTADTTPSVVVEAGKVATATYTVEMYHMEDGASNWVENRYQIDDLATINLGTGTSQRRRVRSEDASDNDFNDSIVNFEWRSS